MSSYTCAYVVRRQVPKYTSTYVCMQIWMVLASFHVFQDEALPPWSRLRGGTLGASVALNAGWLAWANYLPRWGDLIYTDVCAPYPSLCLLCEPKGGSISFFLFLFVILIYISILRFVNCIVSCIITGQYRYWYRCHVGCVCIYISCYVTTRLYNQTKIINKNNTLLSAMGSSPYLCFNVLVYLFSSLFISFIYFSG